MPRTRSKPRTASAHPRVSLPPFPWEIEAGGGDGHRYALARPPVAAVTIPEPGELGEDGTVSEGRSKVWRVGARPWLSYLRRDLRAALECYADAVERLEASGGTLDPTGVGGGAASAGPSHARLAAAERLSGMRGALAGWGGWLPPSGQAKPARWVRHEQVVHWAAVDGLRPPEALERAGIHFCPVMSHNSEADKRITIILRDAAQLLVLHLSRDRSAKNRDATLAASVYRSRHRRKAG